MLNNKDHFLHKQATLELYKEGDFFELLKTFGIPFVTPNKKPIDNSSIDWEKVPGHKSFCYSYDGAEEEIKDWLLASELNKKEFVLTYFTSSKKIIKVNTLEFIENWEDFNFAIAFMGLIIVSHDGELILEFTDDYKYNLNSNFKIKK